MGFQNEEGVIRWKMHFKSSKEIVFKALSTDAGRLSFWAESAPEQAGVITFKILGYPESSARIVQVEPPSLFKLEYFGTLVQFDLNDDGNGGTDLSLIATNVDESYRMEMVAGWVSVLMAMKAAVDFNVDLRNHDENRTWTKGYADN